MTTAASIGTTGSYPSTSTPVTARTIASNPTAAAGVAFVTIMSQWGNSSMATIKTATIGLTESTPKGQEVRRMPLNKRVKPASDMEPSRARQSEFTKRNLPRAALVWHPLVTGDADNDVECWEHNVSAQQVAIVDVDGEFRVEARYGDVIVSLESWATEDEAQMYALGVRQGAIDGEVVRDA